MLKNDGINPDSVWYEIDKEDLEKGVVELPEEAFPKEDKFVVMIPGHGFYVSEVKGSIFKKDARVFESMELADEIAKKVGGKVMRL